MRTPGMPKTGGRKKGVPNKINSVAREAFLALFRKFMDAGDLEKWIRQTGDSGNPGKAAELLLRMAEYHFPKAPTEITGKDGEPVTLDFRIDLKRANEE